MVFDSWNEDFNNLRQKVLRLRREFLDVKKDIDNIDNKGFGVLSDRDIKQRLNTSSLIHPVKDEYLQPCSVDVHLSNILINLDKKEYNITDEDYVLQPGEFILGSTFEKVNIPNDLVAQLDGKSSIARLGIDVHKTAGWIDAGFRGNITLEIKNDSDKPFILQYMMPIGQVIFFTLTSPVERPYGHNELNNHYQDSKGTIYSRHMRDDNL